MVMSVCDVSIWLGSGRQLIEEYGLDLFYLPIKQVPVTLLVDEPVMRELKSIKLGQYANDYKSLWETWCADPNGWEERGRHMSFYDAIHALTQITTQSFEEMLGRVRSRSPKRKAMSDWLAALHILARENKSKTLYSLAAEMARLIIVADPTFASYDTIVYSDIYVRIAGWPGRAEEISRAVGYRDGVVGTFQSVVRQELDAGWAKRPGVILAKSLVSPDVAKAWLRDRGSFCIVGMSCDPYDHLSLDVQYDTCYSAMIPRSGIVLDMFDKLQKAIQSIMDRSFLDVAFTPPVRYTFADFIRPYAHDKRITLSSEDAVFLEGHCGKKLAGGQYPFSLIEVILAWLPQRAMAADFKRRADRLYRSLAPDAEAFLANKRREFICEIRKNMHSMPGAYDYAINRAGSAPFTTAESRMRLIDSMICGSYIPSCEALEQAAVALLVKVDRHMRLYNARGLGYTEREDIVAFYPTVAGTMGPLDWYDIGLILHAVALNLPPSNVPSFKYSSARSLSANYSALAMPSNGGETSGVVSTEAPPIVASTTNNTIVSEPDCKGEVAQTFLPELPSGANRSEGAAAVDPGAAPYSAEVPLAPRAVVKPCSVTLVRLGEILTPGSWADGGAGRWTVDNHKTTPVYDVISRPSTPGVSVDIDCETGGVLLSCDAATLEVISAPAPGTSLNIASGKRKRAASTAELDTDDYADAAISFIMSAAKCAKIPSDASRSRASSEASASPPL